MDEQGAGDEGAHAAGWESAPVVDVRADGLSGEMELLRVTLQGLAQTGQVKMMLRAVDGLSRAVSTQQRRSARDGGLAEVIASVAEEILDGPADEG